MYAGMRVHDHIHCQVKQERESEASGAEVKQQCLQCVLIAIDLIRASDNEWTSLCVVSCVRADSESVRRVIHCLVGVCLLYLNAVLPIPLVSTATPNLYLT